MMRFVLFACFVLGLAAPAAAQQPVLEHETMESLPDHPGREETFGFCAACHSFKVVGRQGMSRERWADTLGWMTEKHSMPKLEGADLELILDYLAKVYPASQQPQGGWKNPFAK
jgi:hypothetical protein